jgi:hypothetical protein
VTYPPAVQEATLKHRITDLEDEELFIGAKLMDALGWTGRTATLDEIVEEVATLRAFARASAEYFRLLSELKKGNRI